uniref:Diphthine methyl ester synthase n=1 Tax=Cucumis melo TaxID=3656 RepID=A0A9I9E5R0_CUCME
MVEEKTDQILSEACTSNVAFLVVGDAFRATIHYDLVVRAKSLGIEVRVVYNASVMNVIRICGLQLYCYGKIVSIPFFTETWKSSSFYEKIQKNRGLESLSFRCDIRSFMTPPKLMALHLFFPKVLTAHRFSGAIMSAIVEYEDIAYVPCYKNI